MNLKNFMDGLQALLPYYEKPDDYHLGAEHDQIYVYRTDKPLSANDVQTMRDLGWFQPEQDDGEDYDPGMGWTTFV